MTLSLHSRWLPTVLCAAHDKVLINAALGFDSYLVMRHGCSPLEVSKAVAAPPFLAPSPVPVLAPEPVPVSAPAPIPPPVLDFQASVPSSSSSSSYQHCPLPAVPASSHDVNPVSTSTLPIQSASSAISSFPRNHKRLGCYFCSDIVAATNSQRDRSLDQQCTVTRYVAV